MTDSVLNTPLWHILSNAFICPHQFIRSFHGKFKAQSYRYVVTVTDMVNFDITQAII